MLCLTVILLVALATRLYHIEQPSIWFDEGWSAYAAVQPTLWQAALADLTNPPLYYMLLYLNAQFLGDSEFSLRWFSLMLGLLTIPLSYLLARRLFDTQAGVYAALLVAASPLLWWASQEARMYTLLAVLVLIAALAWHQLLRQPTRLAWLAVFLSELSLLYAHNTGPVVVLWLNAATLIAWIVHRNLRRPPFFIWIIGQIIVGLLWLPWFITQFLDLQQANSAVTTTFAFDFPFLSRVWQSFWVGVWPMVNAEPVLITFSSVAFWLSLALIPWRKANARWLVLHALLLVGGVLLGLLVLGNELHGRYLVMAAPLLVIPLGAGIARLPHSSLRTFMAGIFVIGFGVAVILAQNPTYQHDDARGMVRYYADNLTAADSVLAWSYADRYELAYYWNRLGVTAQRITLPEGGDLDAILPLLPTSGDVALNVWYTQRADLRGMMACVLGNGTVNEPEQHDVYGMSNLLYRSPSLNLPDLRTFAATALASRQPLARVNALGVLPTITADRALCLPVDIQLEQATNADLKATLIVLNALGWEIARSESDAIFATANQRTTAQLHPGEHVTAYPLIRLPVGTPPGDYDVRLRIYDEQLAPSGYDLTTPDHPMATKDLPVGTWQVEAGADWSQVRRPTELPAQVDVPVSDNLRLSAHSAPCGEPVNNGAVVPLSLLWTGDDNLPPLIFAAINEGWQVKLPPPVSPHDSLTLDWRQVQVPLDAPAGAAEIRLPAGEVLATCVIENLPMLLDEPEAAFAVNFVIPPIGMITGYTLTDIDHTQPLPVTLIWRADSTPLVGYTVFLQLIDAQGQLIAQSDSVPAQATRPTTGWRPGEYIVDAHTLQFNDLAAPGGATLIAGVYDSRTGQRVLVTPTGQDFVVLAEGLEIK